MPRRNHQSNGTTKNIKKKGENQWAQQNNAPKAWSDQNTIKKLGLAGHTHGSGVDGGLWDSVSAPLNCLSLNNGNFRETNVDKSDDVYEKDVECKNVEEDDDSNEFDEDDEIFDDDYDDDDDDDDSEIDEESLKNGFLKWFFISLDSLTIQQINDPQRQWHCAACKGGQGAIDWYRGIHAVISHCRTIGSRRVKLHRAFAKILDQGLKIRGSSIIPPGEIQGKWMNPCVSDKAIVWPPMVMIMNTRYQQDENGKWVGMGNQELVDYFSPYEPLKARHSYGPKGHRGMSVLIFESSVVGYHNVDRLGKDFEESGKGRDPWDRVRFAILPGGKRQLFGFMAERKDLESFNQHCQEKAVLKFDMRLYQQVIVNQMRQLSEENQELMFFKNKAAKEKMHSKALEESFGYLSEHLKKTLEESRIVRERTKMHHEENKEEMDYQEKFFHDQLKIIHEARNVKEENFEKIQQEERNSVEDSLLKDDEVQKFIKCEDKEVGTFIAEREALRRSYEARRLELKKRYWKKEISMEKEFDDELTKIMEKYASKTT